MAICVTAVVAQRSFGLTRKHKKLSAMTVAVCTLSPTKKGMSRRLYHLDTGVRVSCIVVIGGNT